MFEETPRTGTTEYEPDDVAGEVCQFRQAIGAGPLNGAGIIAGFFSMVSF